MDTASPAPVSEIKHPYYSMTLPSARSLGASLCSRVPCDPHPPAVPDRDALAAIERERRECGFNWITGRVAAELLLTQITGRDHFTT